MENSTLRKTAFAAAVAGVLAASAPAGATNVFNVAWTGAFTFLDLAGMPAQNAPSDWAYGYLPNGGPGLGSLMTTNGWYGWRTPVSGTLSLDEEYGAGVGTINPFYFLGDTPGSGPGTSVASISDFTLALIDNSATYVGTMLFSWNGTGHQVSIVLDASGLISNAAAMIAAGPTSTLYGVGALPATDGLTFGSPVNDLLPLGPSPVATTTRNALGCEGQLIAVQIPSFGIVPITANLANCDLTQDDGFGGSPVVGPTFSQYSMNFDFQKIEFVSVTSSTVPLPPALWLFGSGLLGLIGMARRKQPK
jgi:hypothetical protein